MPRYRVPQSLTEAIHRRDHAAIDRFIENKDELNRSAAVAAGREKNTPLVLAVELSDLDLVQRLIEKGASVNGNGLQTSPITKAIWDGNLDVLKILHKNGARLDTDASRENYLLQAVEQNQPKVLQWLIEQGLNPKAPPHKKKGGTLLEVCLRGFSSPKKQEVFDTLMDAGLDPMADASGKTATLLLGQALYMGNPHIVKRLLQAGCNPNAIRTEYNSKCEGENCPLIITAISTLRDRTHQVEILKLMKAYGARFDLLVEFNCHTIGACLTIPKNNPGLMDASRYTNAPLCMFAATWGSADTLDFLIKEGQSIEYVDKNGNTMLHAFFDKHARGGGDDSILRLTHLLNAGADIHAKNKNGDPALHSFLRAFNIASTTLSPRAQNAIQIIELFLSRGFELGTLNSKGQTIGDIVRPYEPIYEHLRSYIESRALQSTTPAIEGPRGRKPRL